MKTLVILLPGNPSVPGIYDPFLKQVVNDLALNGEVISKVLPHLGQCNQKKIKIKNLDVFDVIEEHRENIHRQIKLHAPDKTILIGHSLGSGVLISLYHELQSIINHFVILCPFLGPSKNNIGYLKMFKNPITRFGMKRISYTALSSHKLSKTIFKQWLGENPFNDHIPKEIKQPNYIENFMTLLSNYIPDFERLNLKEQVRRMSPENSFFLFASDDYWVPETVLNYLPSGARYHIHNDIRHDFCLIEDQFQIVAKTVAKNLKF